MKIINNEENPVEKEVLAEAIVRISEGVNALSKSGINKKGIIALVHDRTKQKKGDIGIVIDALAELKSLYCVKGK